MPNPIYAWRRIMIFTMWVCYLKVGTKSKKFSKIPSFTYFMHVSYMIHWALVEFLILQFTPIPLRPVHTRYPINPRSLPLWKNGRIGNERALIGESVCWSKIQRGLVGPALRGRGERDEFFNRLKNGRGWSRSPQVVCWAGVQRGGRRYSVGWSYFDRVWSAIQRN